MMEDERDLYIAIEQNCCPKKLGRKTTLPPDQAKLLILHWTSLVLLILTVLWRIVLIEWLESSGN